MNAKTKKNNALADAEFDANDESLEPITERPSVQLVELDNPIVRGEKQFTTIEVREPNTKTLMGLALSDIATSDVKALTVLLPRITQPKLIAADFNNMSMADLTALGAAVISFLQQKNTH